MDLFGQEAVAFADVRTRYRLRQIRDEVAQRWTFLCDQQRGESPLALISPPNVFYDCGDAIRDGAGAVLYDDIAAWTADQRALMAVLHSYLTTVDYEHAWDCAVAFAAARGDHRAPPFVAALRAARDFHCANVLEREGYDLTLRTRRKEHADA